MALMRGKEQLVLFQRMSTRGHGHASCGLVSFAQLAELRREGVTDQARHLILLREPISPRDFPHGARLLSLNATLFDFFGNVSHPARSVSLIFAVNYEVL